MIHCTTLKELFAVLPEFVCKIYINNPLMNETPQKPQTNKQKMAESTCWIFKSEKCLHITEILPSNFGPSRGIWDTLNCLR